MTREQCPKCDEMFDISEMEYDPNTLSWMCKQCYKEWYP